MEDEMHKEVQNSILRAETQKCMYAEQRLFEKLKKSWECRNQYMIMPGLAEVRSWTAVFECFYDFSVPEKDLECAENAWR